MSVGVEGSDNRMSEADIGDHLPASLEVKAERRGDHDRWSATKLGVKLGDWFRGEEREVMIHKS